MSTCKAPTANTITASTHSIRVQPLLLLLLLVGLSLAVRTAFAVCVRL
jgi:hypothetical protein